MLVPKEDREAFQYQETSYPVQCFFFTFQFKAYTSSRCLAHIINLTTQALISKRSKSKFYDPKAPDDHIPDVTAVNCDEVGLIQAICIKVGCIQSYKLSMPLIVNTKARSSAQCKELFKKVQQCKGLDPLQLLIDMKVWWARGSTYAMLNRADVRREAINTFVYELGTKENDLEKRKKIDALALKDSEWAWVKQFCNLLLVRHHYFHLCCCLYCSSMQTRHNRPFHL